MPPYLTMKHQLILAAALTVFGVVLLMTSFTVPPMGYIDPTVLTAFGEILTFSGSLIGIDYHYASRNNNHR